MFHQISRKAVRRLPLVALFALLMLVGSVALNGVSTAYADSADLLICKVAGTGVANGANFTFNAGGVIKVVAAGSCTDFGQFTQGTNVTVQETVPSGMQVSAISVGQNASLVSSNLTTGTAVVGIGPFHNTVTFTNQVIPPVVRGCTLTQGFWKNHSSAWPVGSLTLGTVSYTKAQLLQILNQPVQGNGLIALAYQLIAARLNQLSGASTPASVQTAINQANALIGALVVPPIGSGFLDPSVTSALTDILDQYNSGLALGGPPHCD